MLVYTMPPPSLAVDGGRVFVAWVSQKGVDQQVLVRHSDDGGASWGSAVKANDDLQGDGRVHELPRIAVSPNGRVDLIFYDRRRDPSNIRDDVYYTWSTNDGKTFAPNMRLDSQSSDTRSGQRYLNVSARGLVEFGSRIALYSEATGIVTAWTDTRGAQITPYQDVWATEVTFDGAPDARGVAIPILIFTLGASAFLLAWQMRSRWAGRRAAEPEESARPRSLVR
jgi:hypothetical protein